MYNVYGHWLKFPEVKNKFTEFMQNPNVLNFSRIGGSDYLIVKHYYNDNSFFDNQSNYDCWLKMAKNYNGYFDFANKKENFMLYVQQLLKYYKDSDAACYCNSDLIYEIDGQTPITKETINFLNYIIDGKTIINFSFIEDTYPFLETFKIWGEGKKILIVSPFSQSLQYQYKRIDKIINNYTWPNFELSTVSSNLTWQADTDTKETLDLMTDNWHEEVERLQDEISKIDFDIAFLSCGSYAMSAGYFIKNTMGKKSIYIGGPLNTLFGIYGGRYDIPQCWGITDPEYRLNPFENEKVKKVTAGRISYDGCMDYFGEAKKE